MIREGSIIAQRPYPSPTKNVELSEITYCSQGLKVKGLLAIPKQVTKDGLLYLRGGIQRVGMVRPARICQFAQQGFIVFAPYYRGNRGGEGRDTFGGDDRYDAVNGAEVLKQFSENLFVTGFSRGGIMTLWTLVLRKDIVAAATWAGTVDMFATYEERVDLRRMLKRVVGGTPKRVPEAYAKRNPLNYVEAITTPLLIIHGARDVHVHIAQAYMLRDALKAHHKDYETWFYKDYPHAFPAAENRQMVRDLSSWLKKHKVH